MLLIRLSSISKYAFLLLLTAVLPFFTFGEKIIPTNAKMNAKLDYYQAKVEREQGVFTALLPYYDTIISIYFNKGEKEAQIKYMIKKADFANENGNNIKSYNIYREILAELKKLKPDEFTQERKDCLYSIARNALDMGMFDESVAYTYELLNYVNEKDPNYMAKSYSILSFILFNLNKIKESEEFNERAQYLIRTTDTLSPLTLFSVYNTYAGTFFTKKEVDSAIKYLTIAKKYTQDLKDPKTYNIIYHNFAIVYEEIGEYSVAKDYYLLTLESISKQEQQHLKALTYSSLARLSEKIGEKDKAMNYYEQAIKIASLIGAIRIRGDALIAMSNLFYQKQDYKTSRDLLVKGHQALDSVFNSQNSDRILLLTNNFETHNEKIKSMLETQTMKLFGLRRNILIVTIALVLVLIAIIIFKYSKQSLANKILHKTVNILTQKNKQYEENSKHKFESIIDIKNKELASTTLSLFTANDIILEIKENYCKLKDCHHHSERQELFKKIDQLFKNYNPDIDSENEEFRQYFEQVKQSFFVNLNEKFPDLNYSEQRICTLLILNLSAKEIANITNKSIRTVETNIYHLRKIMNIPSKVKTVTFLRQFVI